MKEVYFPDGVWRIIQHMTTLYVAPTREEGVYIALRNWYLEKSNLLHSYFGIRSFYVKTLKRKKKKNIGKNLIVKDNSLPKKDLLPQMKLNIYGFFKRDFSL